MGVPIPPRTSDGYAARYWREWMRVCSGIRPNPDFTAPCYLCGGWFVMFKEIGHRGAYLRRTNLVCNVCWKDSEGYFTPDPPAWRVRTDQRRAALLAVQHGRIEEGTAKPSVVAKSRVPRTRSGTLLVRRRRRARA